MSKFALFEAWDAQEKAKNALTLTNRMIPSFSKTNNVFDVNKLIEDYSVSSTTGNLLSQGEGSDFNALDFTEVEPDTQYVKSGSQHVAFYDESKTFISGIGYGLSSKNFITPANTKYIRVTVKDSENDGDYMIYKGSSLPNEYVPLYKLKAEYDIQNALQSVDNVMEFYTKTKNVFDKTKIIPDYSVSSSTGELIPQSDSDFNALDYVEIKPSTNYVKSGSQHVAFYDANKTFISGISYGLSSKNFVTPSNTKFLRITVKDGENIPQYMIYEGSSLPDEYVPTYEFTFDEGKKPLKTKKWVSYGDSLTQMNVWQSQVAEKLNLSHVVRGIGSTTVTEIGSTAYVDSNGMYVDRPTQWGGSTDTPPEGTTEILSSLSNDERIATIPTDAEVVTLLAGTNDMNMSKIIGTGVDLMNVNEFKSAYAITIKKIMQRVGKQTRLFTITLPQSNKGTTENTNGDTPRDYAQAIREVSDMYGIPCIDLFSECGWNEYNMDAFLSDGVHPLDTGAERMAQVISNGMDGLVY